MTKRCMFDDGEEQTQLWWEKRLRGHVRMVEKFTELVKIEAETTAQC